MEKSRDDVFKEFAELDYYSTFTVPSDDLHIPYDLRRLDAYCEEKGIDPSTLTDEELKQFEV